MGYTTEFEGAIAIHPPLTVAEFTYLKAFANTRHMKRGKGPYHVGEERGSDVIDQNSPPDGQPGLWCHWIPNEDGTALVWDGGEKFYHATEWMQYLLDHFLGPNAKAVGKVKGITGGHTLTGIIEASGEERGDIWHIVVTNGRVEEIQGTPSAHTRARVEAARL